MPSSIRLLTLALLLVVLAQPALASGIRQNLKFETIEKRVPYLTRFAPRKADKSRGAISYLFDTKHALEVNSEPKKAYPEEYEEWFEEIIPKLIEKESSGDDSATNWEDAKKTGEPSVGCLQFQPKTFTRSIEMYDVLPRAEKNEYENLLRDCQTQVKVAKAILFNEKEGWRHWYTSFRRYNLPRSPRVQSDETLSMVQR